MIREILVRILLAMVITMAISTLISFFEYRLPPRRTCWMGMPIEAALKLSRQEQGGKGDPAGAMTLPFPGYRLEKMPIRPASQSVERPLAIIPETPELLALWAAEAAIKASRKCLRCGYSIGDLPKQIIICEACREKEQQIVLDEMLQPMRHPEKNHPKRAPLNWNPRGAQ